MAHSRSNRDEQREIDLMFSKKIKFLVCNIWACRYRIFMLTKDGEKYWWSQTSEEEYKEISASLLRPSKPLYDYHWSDNIDWTNIKTRIVKTAVHPLNCLALTDDGKLYYIAKNYSVWTNLFYTSKRKIDIKKKITLFACGANYCVIITNNGEVYEWDYCPSNDNPKMKEFFLTKPRKIQLPTQTKIVKVVCGNWRTIILTDKGKIYAWERQTNSCCYNNKPLSTVKHYKITEEICFPCVDIEEICQPIMIKLSNMIRYPSDIATIAGADAIKCNKDQLVYIWGVLFGKKIKESAICEYTNIFDICNLTIAQPPITHTDEENMILSDLGIAFNDSSTSDLIIEVEKKPIYVHKFILKLRSVYYQNMFNFNGLENKQRVIKYDDYSYIVYEAFLKYLYTGVIDLLSLENELELLKLSDKFCMESLERDCIRNIKKKITASNVDSIIKVATIYNKTELEEYCFKFKNKTGNILERLSTKLQQYIITFTFPKH